MLLVAPAVVNRNLLDVQEITLSWYLQRYFIAEIKLRCGGQCVEQSSQYILSR